MSAARDQNQARRPSGRLLARNSFYTLIGQGIPALIAIFALRAIRFGLGVEQLGFLNIALIVVGYASLFDFGMGRALTKIVSERLALQQRDGLGSLVWSSLAAMLVLSLVVSAALFLATGFIVHDWLHISAQLQDEARLSWQILSIVVPIVVLNAGTRGILEACQRFDITNSINVSVGALQFAVPIVLISFAPSLVWVVGSLCVIRCLGMVVQVGYMLKVVPETGKDTKVRFETLRPVISFGGWVTLSALITPILDAGDRFVVGKLMPNATLAYYATPADFLGRLSLLPSAISRVAFPAFSATYHSDRERVRKLYFHAIGALLAILAPISFLLVALAPWWLGVWLGADFAEKSTPVVKWLALGVLFNGIASVPFSLIQGLGKPSVTTLFHAIELPLFIPLIWFLTLTRGLEGAAMAWCIRVALDAILLLVAAARLFPELRLLPNPKALVSLVSPLVLITVVGLPMPHGFKLGVCALGMLFFAWLGTSALRGGLSHA